MSCVICNGELSEDEVVIVKERGLKTLKKFSELRKDGLINLFESVEEIALHTKCRKKYVKENTKGIYEPLLRPRSGVSGHSSCSSVATAGLSDVSAAHQFQEKCFFCDEKMQEKNEIICTVTSDQTKSTILSALSHESSEEHEAVLRRIENVDLKNEMARYHRKCYLNCLRPRKGLKRGRPEANDVTTAMQIIFEYIDESSDPQFSLRELKGLLKDYVPDDRTIIGKLEKKYESRILIYQKFGKTIITFKDSVDEILAEHWYLQKESNLDEEKLRIVKKAADIIREDICLKVFERDVYPAPQLFLEKAKDDVPRSLELFLKTLVGKQGATEELQRKLLSLAHTIIMLLRPKKFLSCILTALAVTIKKKYGSKLLINILNRLGFCASYNEANVFEVSAINFKDTESNKNQLDFVQFVFDNADANIDTIDGKNTFHAMGGIQCSSSPLKKDTLNEPMPRISNVPSAEIIGSFGHVPLQHYSKRSNGLQKIIVEQCDSDNRIVPHVSDILWLYGQTYNIEDIGGWNGFMQNLHKRDLYEISEIKALPFINAPPSDFDTVNTALIMASQKTAEQGQRTTFVTFDQPLYSKAREIIASAPDVPLYKNIIIRIGGFHLLMSYMGSIGFAMVGSGLKELWSIIYAPNSVNQMVTGHAYARALRAHQLTYLALGELIFRQVKLTDSEIFDIENVLCNNDISEKDFKSATFEQLTDKFDEAVTVLESKSPTAKLWIQYFKMVCLIKKFIEAERSGNFKLHLQTIKNMLPIFVASGHFNYGKSLVTYLQDMNNLHESMPPAEYEKFTGGLFTIRRTDKFWSGTWSDMVIEQSLMRTMKVAGGLTRGRSLTDSVLAKWVLSMPTTQKIEECLEAFCDLNNERDEMHTDSTPSRIKRDKSDVTKLIDWFDEHPPFRNEPNKIVSISTGVAGDPESINCHDVFNVGRQILQKKVGLKFTELSYARKDKVQPLATINSSVKCNDSSTTPIDPLTIFQRISFVKKDEKEMKEYFSYELAPYPLALFDEYGLRKTRKSALYELFQPIEEMDLPQQNVLYVVDGGHLLHRVVWRKGDTYDAICVSIVDFLKRHYGSNITCVFDGYDENTLQQCTKTSERLRRSSRKCSADVIFDGSMAMTTSQEDFLSNDKNKSRFIALLTKHLKQCNIDVVQSQSDADVDIVSTALNLSIRNETVAIVGDDIDLLVLMTAMAQDETNIYFLKPGKGKQQTKVFRPSSFKYPELKSHILTLHAFGGCDTTSALFNIGKKKHFDVVNRQPTLKNALNVFTNKNASTDEVTKAGEQFMVAIYGGEITKSPDLLRYEKFARSLTKNKLNLACLPPTKNAAHQHSLRVYHQVQLWSGNPLDPKEYGWTLQNNYLTPVTTLLQPAPENILQMLFCRCKTSCGAQCGCRKAGLKCSDICENCKGQSCTNRSEINFEDREQNSDVSDDDVDNVSHNYIPSRYMRRRVT